MSEAETGTSPADWRCRAAPPSGARQPATNGLPDRGSQQQQLLLVFACATTGVVASYSGMNSTIPVDSRSLTVNKR